MTIKCEICSIEYKTINALLRHNTMYHNEQVIDKNLQQQLANSKRKHFCSKCNKPYASRQSKWKHEQTCNNESPFVTLTEQVKQMSQEINELKTISHEIKELKNKPSVINNYTTNNTLNNKKIVINASTDDYNSISDLEIDEIIIKGKRFIIEDTFVFVKNIDNTKGEIYGKYVNGKVIKLD
jgi:hypothetical protein